MKTQSRFRKSYYLINKNLEKYAQEIENGTSTSSSTSKYRLDLPLITGYTNKASSSKALDDSEPPGSSLFERASIKTVDMHCSTHSGVKRLQPVNEKAQSIEPHKRKRLCGEVEHPSSGEELIETARVPTSSTEKEISSSTLKKKCPATSPPAFLQEMPYVNNSKARKALAPVNCCNFNTENNMVDRTTSENDDTKLNLILQKLDVLTRQHDILKQQQHSGFAILLKQLENIISEQKVIKKMLAKLESPETIEDREVISKLPLLPASSMDDLTALEKAIECPDQKELLIRRLSLIGGAKFTTTVYNIMRALLSKSVAIKFSLLGKQEKMAFTDLKLYNCVMEAVRRTSRGQGSSDHDIRQTISLNLIGARDRGNGRQERQKKYEKSDAS